MVYERNINNSEAMQTYLNDKINRPETTKIFQGNQLEFTKKKENEKWEKHQKQNF